MADTAGMNSISASRIGRDGHAARRIAGAWRVGIAAVALVISSVATLAIPASPAAADVTFNQRVLQLVNRDRAANGLAPLVSDPALSGAAEDAPYNGCGFTVAGRAKDMGLRNYFSHTILGCGTQGVFNLLGGLGIIFSGAGENIGWLNATTDPIVAAENMHSQWMNSPGHRANVLNPNFTRLGVGSWRTAPGQMWSGGGFALPNVFIGVQIFAGGAVSTTTPPPTTTPPTTVPPTTVPPTTTTVPPAAGGARFHPVTPSRILDTRNGNGAPAAPLGGGATMNLQVTGRGGVPAAGVTAVVVNVTVTEPTAPSYLTVYPAGQGQPGTANLNFMPGQTVPNLVTAKVGANGQLSIFNLAGSVHVIADVAGWYDNGALVSGADFHPLTPSRILDTRTGNGAPAGALGPGATLNLQVTGRGGVPATGVSGVVVNVTVTEPTSISYLTVFPAGEPRPLAANLNFLPGQTVPNLVTAKVGANGQLSIFNALGNAHVVADVAGWYDTSAVAGGAQYHPVTPSRILDTRTGNGAPLASVGPGGTLNVQVTGRGGVPSTGVTGVVVNVTVTEPTAMSFLTAFPSGQGLPPTANLTYTPGLTVPNLVVAKVGANGQISLFNAVGNVHVVADVAGWFDAG